MLRVLAAVLVLACAAGARAKPAREHVDPDAIRETRRPEAGRYASPRAISHYLEARRHARAGDAEKAAEHLRLAVAYDEESPELRVSLATALAAAGQLERAEGEARRALELARAGPSASEAHVLLGRIAAARRQLEQAILSFRNAIRLESAGDAGEPVDGEAWKLLADAYLEAGDEDAAVRTLDDLARHAPTDGAGFRELGRAFLERKEPARAERHLRRAAELDPRDAETHRLLAEVHEALRREPEARDDLLAVLRAEPDDAEALLALGRMAVRQGELAQAREWFHRHARASPSAVEAHVRVAFQWLEAGHADEALATARAALEDGGPDPRLRLAEGLSLRELRRWGEAAEALGAVKAEAGDLFRSARVAQADALSRAGRHPEAERALEAPLAMDPGDLRLLTARAAVLDRAGRATDSVALLRRALAEAERTSPADAAELHAALAESLVHAGRAAEAVAGLRAAAASRPADPTLLYALGSAYERAGQLDAAIAQMRALLAIQPDHAEAMNFVGYSLAEQDARLDEAERLVRRALELKPRSGHVLDSLGWVLYRRGDLRGAIAALEEAHRLAGPDSTILEHLGDAYGRASRHADAADAYRRALAAVADELPGDRARRRAELQEKLRNATAAAERGERGRR
jgi:tetratricopeptide (TPR) repeat protein